MAGLTAATSPTDAERVSRLPLAWMDGDQLALDVVLSKAADDPVGTPGLLFALTAMTTDLLEQAVPDARKQLRASLLPEAD